MPDVGKPTPSQDGVSDLIISWEQYHDLIESLAVQVYESGWEFDQIVCLARGGLRVGDVLSRLFRKPLGIVFASSYREDGGRSRGEIRFSQGVAMTQAQLGQRLLVADDLADSGVTLAKAVEWLRDRNSDPNPEIRTAVLWYKACSGIAPDYYVEYLADNPWIRQPFEHYEAISLGELSQNRQSQS
jgi:hypoxanthine phosphoribosyltransferase